MRKEKKHKKDKTEASVKEKKEKEKKLKRDKSRSSKSSIATLSSPREKELEDKHKELAQNLAALESYVNSEQRKRHAPFYFAIELLTAISSIACARTVAAPLSAISMALPSSPRCGTLLSVSALF